MTNTIDTIRDEAQQLAIDAGYVEKGDGYPGSTFILTASPGRFEGEPWYLPYFYDSVMNGDGEPIYEGGDSCVADLIDVSDDERIAFELNADTAVVAVTHSDVGFIGLRELTRKQADDLIEAESTYTDDTESD